MKRHAFTLIELLVVVAIIALLISILMPSLAKAKATARMVVCASNLKQMGIAASIYAAENRDFLVPHSTPSSQGHNGRYEWYQNTLFQKVMNMEHPDGWFYYNAPRGLICPDAQWVLDHPGGAADATNKYTTTNVIDPEGLYRLDLSYGMNPRGFPAWTDSSGNVQYTKIIRGLRRVDVKSPAYKIYMMDSMWSDPTGGGLNKYPDNPDATFVPPANLWAIAWRHDYVEAQSGLCNVLHYDLHVEPLMAGYDPALPMNDSYRWNPLR